MRNNLLDTLPLSAEAKNQLSAMENKDHAEHEVLSYIQEDWNGATTRRCFFWTLRHDIGLEGTTIMELLDRDLAPALSLT